MQTSLWVCSDCGERADGPGDCKRCGQGPLLDASKEDTRNYLLDDDVQRREKRRNRILWIVVPSLVVADCGGGALLPVKVATVLWSIPGVLLLIAVAIGLWVLGVKAFPARSRFDYLKH